MEKVEDTVVPQRKIGPDGPEVGVLSFGSWHTWNRMGFDEAVRVFDSALDFGVNMFDVGHYNSGLHQEGLDTDVLLGKIIEASKRKRDSIAIAMKLWLWNREHETLTQSFDNDLTRLNTDYVDLIMAGHFRRDDPELFKDDLDEIICEIAELVVSGRARSWSICDWSAADTQRAFDVTQSRNLPHPQMAQLKYSVARRSIPEGDPYTRLFEEFGLTLQASDVLEGGFLVGKKETTGGWGGMPGGS